MKSVGCVSGKNSFAPSGLEEESARGVHGLRSQGSLHPWLQAFAPLGRGGERRHKWQAALATCQPHRLLQAAVSGTAFLFAFLGCFVPSIFGQTSPLVAQPPRHEVRLLPAEYSIVHSAVTSGVTKYGGDAEFRLRLAREGGVPSADGANASLVWTLTITQPRLIDVLQLWMAEKTTELVGVIDFDKLDPETKVAVRAVQSVNLKLTQAKANPAWDVVVTPAVVGVKGGGNRTDTANTANGTPDTPITYTLSAGDEMVEVASPTPALAESLKPLVGKRALVKGYVKATGFIELVSATPVQENTLELVIMSQCPFGVKAGDAVIEYLKSPGNWMHAPSAAQSGGTSPAGSEGGAKAPALSVRYLFYKKQEQGADGKLKTTWWSLHGEGEIEEDLVQIVIRDTFGERFREYVQKRAHEPNAKWRELATLVGFVPNEIEHIAGQIKDNREKIIEAEHAYVSGTLGVTDGSPTFVWESQTVPDIKKVPAFKAVDLSKGSCAGTAEGR